MACKNEVYRISGANYRYNSTLVTCLVLDTQNQRLFWVDLSNTKGTYKFLVLLVSSTSCHVVGQIIKSISLHFIATYIAIYWKVLFDKFLSLS